MGLWFEDHSHFEGTIYIEMDYAFKNNFHFEKPIYLKMYYSIKNILNSKGTLLFP